MGRQAIYVDRPVPYVRTVTENRAPTDESVKILREMEAAAKDSINEAIRVNGTVLKDIVLYFTMTSNVIGTSGWVAKFNLNGNDVTREGVFDYMITNDKRAMYTAIAKDISNYLSTEIVMDMIKNLEV